jgi:hypothetical protein
VKELRDRTPFKGNATELHLIDDCIILGVANPIPYIKVDYHTIIARKTTKVPVLV